MPPHSPTAPLAHVPRAENVYHLLRDQLVLLDIAPGDPLVESKLTAELDVGRTPLREAIKRLEADHLVMTYARRGTFASNVDLAELREISDIRRRLFPLATLRAAELQGGASYEPLMSAIADIEALDSSIERRQMMKLDLAVHRLINSASENQHLEETLTRLDNLVTRMWCLMLDRLPPMLEHIREHVPLIRCIVNGDPAEAERLALEHVAHFDSTVRTVL